ncbi:Plasmodium variant antigen protein Cir/Yir/Bir, putative, partial [Plasmodium chabaudi adami]
MIKEVCNAINSIDKFIWTKQSGAVMVVEYNEVLAAYCPFSNDLGKHACHSYDEMVSSSVLFFLKWLETDYHYKDDLKNDKLAEYAILWLCYKLNKDPQDGINTLNDFYTKHIKTNTNYNKKIIKANDNTTYKDIVYKKKSWMNMNIEDISQFYDAFKSLCNMYTAFDAKNNSCTKCSNYVNEFVVNFEKLNQNLHITEGSPYYQVLSTLSTDYDNLKKKCEHDKSISFPTLSSIKKAQSSALSSDSASSSSSIESKLIPVLSIFAISLFLGIAYKYSLFGIDKRLQRQYLREKIKKIKKKMASY